MDNIPPFLTKDFLKSALENGFKTSNIEIEHFTVVPASTVGENYTSLIHRVCVKYKSPQQGSQKISLILKNVQTSGEARESLRQIDVIAIESNMYTKAIPEIEELIGNSTMIAPKCYAAVREAEVLVLDDLIALGYKLQDRHAGLDEEHCKIVMRKIGQLHGGSIYTIKKHPEYAEYFKRPIFNDCTLSSRHIRLIFDNNFQQMISVVKRWPDYQGIVTKLEKLVANLFQRGFEHCKRKEGELRVINHGDLWVNNMMFKYDQNDKTPVDVAFVDLQLSYYGSLGIDINYFLNTSVQIEVLKSKREELLKVYYQSIKSTLKQLNYSPIPSWEDVRNEIRAKEFFGLLTLGCVFPIIIMEKVASQQNSIEKMHEISEEKHDAMFSSKRMQESLKFSLKRFDELGVLDAE